MGDTEPIPITEEWLKASGFKWQQFERQPSKQWVLWMGAALEEQWTGAEDIGIELADNQHDWFCWLRSDSAHRYHRFIHVRHVHFQHEVIALVEAITGQQWDIANHFYGSVCTPKSASRLRVEKARLDQVFLETAYPWTEHEKDPDRSRPDIEHVDAAIKGGFAK